MSSDVGQYYCFFTKIVQWVPDLSAHTNEIIYIYNYGQLDYSVPYHHKSVYLNFILPLKSKYEISIMPGKL